MQLLKYIYIQYYHFGLTFIFGKRRLRKDYNKRILKYYIKNMHKSIEKGYQPINPRWKQELEKFYGKS